MLPPSGDWSWVELDVSPQLEYSSMSWGASSVAGGGDVNATVFLHPIEDDGLPVGLQPYLQRASGVAVGVGGSAFSLSSQDFNRTGSRASVGAGYAGYPHRNVFVFGNFGLRYADYKDPMRTTSSMELPLNVGGGFRYRDTLVDVGWNVTPAEHDGGSYSVPFWGGAFIVARTVLDRQWYVQVDAYAHRDGASGGITVEEFYGRQLSLWIGGFGGRETDSGTPASWIGARGGISYWMSGHMGTHFEYAPSWNRFDSSNPYTVVDHELTFGFVSRL